MTVKDDDACIKNPTEMVAQHTDCVLSVKVMQRFGSNSHVTSKYLTNCDLWHGLCRIFGSFSINFRQTIHFSYSNHKNVTRRDRTIFMNRIMKQSGLHCTLFDRSMEMAEKKRKFPVLNCSNLGFHQKLIK